MAKGKIYRRKTNSRKERPLVLIVPEGTTTEKEYFQHFNSPEKRVQVEVAENTSRGAKTDYSSLLKKAIFYKKKYGLTEAKGDSVWVVADGDVDYNTPGSLEAKNITLQETRTLAEKNGVTMLVSNPCFELWYYLHFEYSTGFVKDYLSMRDKLLPYLPDYDKNIDEFEMLKDKTDTSIERAKRLEEYHKKNGESLPFKLHINPFTEVFKLVEKIK